MPLYARIKNTNGKLQKVRVIKDKYGPKKDGLQFPDGMVFRREYCETERDVTSTKQNYYCPVCGIYTTSIKALKTHINWKHQQYYAENYTS